MDATAYLSSMLMAVADRPVLLVFAILVATFVLEDIATVTVALLASHMVIDAPVAIVALTVGTFLGDLALYGAAVLAGNSAWVRRALAVAPARIALGWLARHALLVVTVARFVPGLRLPVYLAAGSIRTPFVPFALVVIVTAALWTPALFLTAEHVGMRSMAGLGVAGWTGAALAVAALVLVPRLVRSAARSSLVPASAA